MKNRWQCLILILAMVFGGSAFATNEYHQPTIFSWTRYFGKCRIIQIHSLTEVNGQVYAQSGVGWVLQGEEGFRILTPSHVISGADVIAGQCENSIFPLELQSRTETLDLALLRPLSDLGDRVQPLIHLEKRDVVARKLNERDRELLRIFNPDHFQTSFDELIGRQEGSSYLIPFVNSDGTMKEIRGDWRDSHRVGMVHLENALSSLVVENGAIRPGFSGAPFFVKVQAERAPVLDPLSSMNADAYQQYYLIGMLTKAEVNGSRSLGISLPAILNILPELIREQNSKVDVYARSKDLPVRLRYTNKVQNQSLERNQELVYTYRNGEERIFTEVCEDATVDSSEWSKNAASKKDLSSLIKDFKAKNNAGEKLRSFESILGSNRGSFDKLKATQQQVSGGDYGEGGGGTASLRDSRLMVPNFGGYNMSGSLSAYKREHPCQKIVLKDNSGKVYDAMVFDGRLQKTTNLAEAYKVLSRGIARPASDQEGALCSNLSLNVPDGSTSTTVYPSKNGVPYYYARTEGVASSKPTSKPVGSIECSAKQVRVQYADDWMQTNLLLGNVQTASGTLRVAACKVDLNSKNYSMANRWKHQIRSPLVDMDVNLGQDDRLLTFKILRLDNSCYDTRNGQLWMQEINFSSPEASKKKNARSHRARYLSERGLRQQPDTPIE